MALAAIRYNRGIPPKSMPIGMQVEVVCVLAAGLAALALWAALRKASTPEKRERQRRLTVNTTGRLGDAFITEATGDALYYTYSVRGVQYAASQDISALRDRLPADPERLIGMAGMKYATRNPANSILICEEWTGLRAPAAMQDQAAPKGTSANSDAKGHQAQNAALAEGAER